MPVSMDETDCASLQQEEFVVLDSIYPDYVSSDLSQGMIKLEIPVELPEPYAVTSLLESVASTGIKSTLLPRLSILPPLLLDIILPPSYPLHTAPQILSIHATHSWLPPTLGLQRHLIEMWNEGEGVLYTWVEWIRGGEFLDVLGLTSSSGREPLLRIPHPELKILLPYLTAYETSTQMNRFSQSSYNCQICLTSIKGARCFLLSCSHVFCRACLEDFWKLCITEGDVGRVGCPDPKCVKEGREANEEEVRRVVTEEEVRRWKWLRQKRMLERDPGMVHCPMSVCQRPVPKPEHIEEESGWERLRTCPQCNYSFCVYCKRTWHGPLTDCPLTATEQFVQEYIALPEDSAERVLIERRYGKANVRRLVARYKEEQANRAWLEESSTPCPSCRVRVEKSHGCNHMTCAKCQQHFCYRCGDKLSASNPYEHFSTPGYRCFSKLFDVEDIDNEWQPVEGFDAL